MSACVSTTHGGASVALQLLTAAARTAPPPSTLTRSPDGAAAPVAPTSTGTRISLSIAAAERAFGVDSFLMQTARGVADRVEVSTSLIPVDKDAFRSRVLAFLSVNMKDDAGFMAAFKAGQITVQTVDEVPEFNIQPMVSFSMYRDGNHVGGGTFSPPGTNTDLFEAMGRTRGQAGGSFGSAQVVAHWPRPG